MATGALMVLVGFAAAVSAKLALSVRWRWLAAGAMLWLIALCLKETLLPLPDAAVMGALGSRVSQGLYRVVGAGYVGISSDGLEVVVTLAAGLCWRQLTTGAQRAAAIGFGAGSMEAVLLGLIALTIAMRGTALPEHASVGVALPAVTRLLTIPGHVAVRSMTLYAIAVERWAWFWTGLGLFSVSGAVDAYWHLGGPVPFVNPWMCQLPAACFALVWIGLGRYTWWHWRQEHAAPDEWVPPSPEG
jgi:hypothetical protein